MQRLLIAAIAVVTIAGCRSNPYCLNCKDSGNGVIAPVKDLATAPDLAGSSGPLADMTGMNNGQCVPSNGGVEVCDGLDNDCNGIVDDVMQSKLIGDGNNCGSCGHICSYLHAVGLCIGGFDQGTPTCKLGPCQPGYIDLDGDPTNGCEYTCTPTANPTEICDGKDNNCDGQVDEGFTATWSDAQHQHPLYDDNTKDCGQCGVVCSLGPGTVMACNGTGAGGRGQCAIAGCFNGLDGNGNHVTYKHNPANGMKSDTGCEYQCPLPSTETGVDCDTMTCTFPAETCNGKDDDCNFIVDDGSANPAVNTRCTDGTPGKLCSDGLPPGSSGQCVGACSAGSLLCANGAIVCQNSVGPSPETCNGADDDCNGKIDEPYTATWQVNGKPNYDSDPTHCGGCVTPPPGIDCATSTLKNAVLGCRLVAGDSAGSCYVITCNAGYAYVPKTGVVAGTCNTPAPGPENPTGGTPGVGCFYKCNPATQGPEFCDGLDNDCNGCVDDSLSKPTYFCATKGVCGAPGVQPINIICGGGAGWECDYSSVPGISLEPSPPNTLSVKENQCDGLDNNCSGSCDENFPDVAVAANPAGPPSGTTCGNPHAAHTCTTGLGKCQATSPYLCTKSSGGVAFNDQESCTVTPAATPSAELCNGIDDNCNGQVDESVDDVASGLPGVHDPVAVVAVPLAPVGVNCNDPVLPNGTDPCKAHTVYMYQYEASRPDANGKSAGSLNTRACSTAGNLPWSNVTLAQAQAACAAIKDPTTGKVSIGRLCTAWEWQSACVGVPGSQAGTQHWSIDANGAAPGAFTNATYVSGVCNDANETDERCSSAAQCLGALGCNGNGVCGCTQDVDCNAGFRCDKVNSKCVGSGAWPAGSKGTNAANTCFTPYKDAKNVNAGVYDMTGNLGEWTQTKVVTASGVGATISGFSGGIQTISGLTNGVYNTDVGAQLVISGAATAANNGTFIITGVTFVAATGKSTVTVNNPSGTASDANTVSWSLIYNKERGGSFTSLDSQSSGGGVCEFDFDIQKAAFFNTDLGFRCCFDTAP